MKTNANNPVQGATRHAIDTRWQQILAFGVVPASETPSLKPTASPTTGATFEVMP
jgi:hypothetical protein